MMNKPPEPEIGDLFDLEAEETDERASVFTETGAYLNDTALKAFIEGMKDVEPTPALIEAMRRAKSIRQA